MKGYHRYDFDTDFDTILYSIQAATQPAFTSLICQPIIPQVLDHHEERKEINDEKSTKDGWHCRTLRGAAYIVGMSGFLMVVDVSGIADPIQQIALMAENQAFLTIMHLIVYVI